MFAARLWFLCRWIGHDAVAVLDGGIHRVERARISGDARDLRRVRAKARSTPALHADMLVDADHVLRHLESDKMHLLDARAADRFAGQNETIDPVAGHIPGARNRWFKQNFRERRAPEVAGRAARTNSKPPASAPSRPSINAAPASPRPSNLLAMEHAGLTGSRLYAGSWSEWIADPKRPLAKP